MACGLPGIISAADGASEFIRDGENGLLLAQPGDPVLLGDLLQRALRYAPAERAAMGQAARESWRTAPGDVEALWQAVEQAWPSDGAIATPEARIRWTAFNWLDNNALGLAGMAEREARTA